MQLHEATKKVTGHLFLILATFFYMLGFITRHQLYNYVYHINPRLLKKLLEQDAREYTHKP